MKDEKKVEGEKTPSGGGFMAVITLVVAIYLLYLGFSSF